MGVFHFLGGWHCKGVVLGDVVASVRHDGCVLCFNFEAMIGADY